MHNQPWSVTEDLEGGRLNPSLNLVQMFEKLDSTFEQFKPEQKMENIFITDNIRIFSDRDPRLAGTVILPGSKFKGKEVDIWAGYKMPDGSIINAF